MHSITIAKYAFNLQRDADNSVDAMGNFIL